MKINEHSLSSTEITDVVAMTRIVLAQTPQWTRRQAAAASLAFLAKKEEEAKA